MDVFDQAQQRIEQEEQLRRQAFKPVEIAEGTGECWLEGCEEQISGKARWCCAEHRDIWQREGGLPKEKSPATDPKTDDGAGGT